MLIHVCKLPESLRWPISTDWRPLSSSAQELHGQYLPNLVKILDIDQTNWACNNDDLGMVYQNCKLHDTRVGGVTIMYILDDIYQYTAHWLLLF